MDANCVIYSVERIEPYDRLLQTVWQAAQSASIEIISSELTLLETLVKPIRSGDSQLERIFRELLLHSKEVRLLPISREILEYAARLRAQTSIKTPDAIHAASALTSGCSLMLTNDPAFSKIANLNVTVLSELTTG
ncbi:MAG: PIN domain-containing protein [Armatimonadetes bacterium]|nr:PIN domain-containing protein [Armatimonadota bacterium]